VEKHSKSKPPRTGFYKRLFARYYDRLQADYEEYISPRKRTLFDGVSGTVVEIGPGTGSNFHYLPAGCHWLGIEPNPYMHEPLSRRARAANIEPELRTIDSGRIEVEDSIAHVVISTLVLCSVPNVERVLAEVLRVLRPGGRFLFIEHVAAAPGTSLKFVQQVLWPAWYIFGDGCCINRDTGEFIRRAGFKFVRMEEFRAPRPPVPPWVSPHIIGEAVR